MKNKLRIPAMLFAIALVLAVVASLITNITVTPAITQHDFPYSVTYTLNGETKTMEGIYRCSYAGFPQGQDPTDRYYNKEYIVNGQPGLSHAYTIAEKDGAELYIVTLFNDSYLMGDTKDWDYDTFQDDPYLEAIDKEGYPYEEGNMPAEFTAEIVSWEYPEPVENDFTFSGFSMLHAESMLAMLAVGLLLIVACMICVKRDKTVPYKTLDKVSIVFNFVISLLGIPFITFVAAMLQIVLDTNGLEYQLYMCIPALTAFLVAASVALRRCGYTKAGFFVQFGGPVLFLLPMLMEPFM